VGDSEREACLAHPPGSSEGEQAGLSEEPLHFFDFLLASDEAAERERKVVRLS
jgi:hypothetical protein